MTISCTPSILAHIRTARGRTYVIGVLSQCLQQGLASGQRLGKMFILIRTNVLLYQGSLAPYRLGEKYVAYLLPDFLKD